ncbi:MAG: site-2 protease family protein [Myxococcota bacterium]|nr:site-2 protease family protein [Myxococcales bacterium]
MQDLLHWIVVYAVFLFSVTLHESAHAWAAVVGGDATAYRGGQVTLDPRPHIRREPLGMVVIPWIGLLMSGFPFGWASTPYDPGWAYAFPKRAGWMALAGPASNLALAVVGGVAMRTGLLLGAFERGGPSLYYGVLPAVGAAPFVETLALFLSALFAMNLLLLVLNLVPVPPFDGSGVLALFVDEDTGRRLQEAMRRPGLSMLGMLFVFLVLPGLFGPVLRAAFGWVLM